MKKLLVMAALVSTTVSAKAVIEKTEVSVDVTSQVQIAKISTVEACAVKVDFEWNHEEDTTYTEMIIVKNYSAKKKEIDSLKKKGFRFIGYANQDKCGFKGYSLDSTFPVLKNPNGSEMLHVETFSRYVRASKLAEYARAQGAYKNVERIYIKGDQEFVKKTQKAAQKEVNALIEQAQ